MFCVNLSKLLTIFLLLFSCIVSHFVKYYKFFENEAFYKLFFSFFFFFKNNRKFIPFKKSKGK